MSRTTVEDVRTSFSRLRGVMEALESRLLLAGTPPLAVDDFASTDEATPVNIEVLANDNDVESDINPFTLAVASDPANGLAFVDTGLNTIFYTPNEFFAGVDSFTYTVQDDQGNLSNAATVTIEVGGLGTSLEFDALHWASFRNGLGDLVHVGMQGPGSGVAYVTSLTEGDITRIDMTGTGPASGLLVLTSSPPGATTLGGLTTDGPLRSLYAPRVNLAGAVDIQGLLGSLTMHDVRGPATLTAMAGPAGTSLYLDDVRDFSVTVDGRLGVVQAQRWLDTDEASDTLIADGMDRLLITGSRAREMAGDFEADLSLGRPLALVAMDEGISLPAVVQALGLALVQGEVRDNLWDIVGNVGQILINGHAARWDLSVEGMVQTAVVMGPLMFSQVTISGLLGVLRSGGWLNTNLRAGQINSLQVLGHMGNSNVTADGPVRSGWRALGMAQVTGNINTSTWSIGGPAGSIRAGDVTDWSLGVAGGLANLGTGAASNLAVDVAGLLQRCFTGAWNGGLLRADRAGIVHVAGDLQANVSIGESVFAIEGELKVSSIISTSYASRLLNILSVCGTLRSANVSVGGSAGLIHARSLDYASILVGSGEQPAVLDLLVLGHPSGGQSVTSSDVSAHTIRGIYFVGRPDISGLTVQYHLNPFVWPGRLASVNWVQV